MDIEGFMRCWNKLIRRCQASPDGFDAGVYDRGVEVLQHKFGVSIYLKSFRPQGMKESESPTAVITITPTEPDDDDAAE